MEIDKAGAGSGAGCEIEEQDAELMSITEEESSGGSQTAGSSYECSFCKRGFTNAQALGGHMNIHRKEKAKLKQSISSPSLSSSNKMPVVGHDRGGDSQNTTLTLEETLIGEAPQLIPLFVDKPDQKTTVLSFQNGSDVPESWILSLD